MTTYISEMPATTFIIFNKISEIQPHQPSDMNIMLVVGNFGAALA